MTTNIQGILNKYDLQLESARFHKRSNRLDVVLSSKTLPAPELCGEVQQSLVKVLRTAATKIDVLITCPNIDSAVKNDFDAAVSRLKAYVTRMHPECLPAVAVSKWALADNAVTVKLPDRYAGFLNDAITDTVRRLRITLPISVLSDDEQTYEADKEQLDTLRNAVHVAEKAAIAPAAKLDKKKPTSPDPDSDRKLLFGNFIPQKAKITPMRELKRMASDIKNSDKLDAQGKLPGKTVYVKGRIIPLTDADKKQREQNPARFRQIIADDTSAVTLSTYKDDGSVAVMTALIQDAEKHGETLVIKGKLCAYAHSDDYYIIPFDVCSEPPVFREDTAEHKRVELHLHTTMSQMDALTKPQDAINMAARWGHKAIAITDHGVAHAFPEAMGFADKAKIKLLYGVEGYLQNDSELASDYSETGVMTGDYDFSAHHAELDVTAKKNSTEFVHSTLETSEKRLVSVAIITLNILTDKYFVEISALDHSSGKEFHVNINAGIPIPAKFQYKYDASVMNAAPSTEEAISRFAEFMKGGIAVTYDGSGYLDLCRVAKRYAIDLDPRHVDAKTLTHYLYPKINADNIDTAADVTDISREISAQPNDNALPIAAKTADIFYNLCKRLKEGNCPLPLMLDRAEKQKRGKRGNYYHIILLATNRTGLKNMYKMISFSHAENFHMEPLIPRSLFAIRREGVILGSACERGELFRAMMAGVDDDNLRRIASWYDYLEVQPIGNNAFMLRNGTAESEETLRDFNRHIIAIGDSLGLRTVATGDVHFLNPDDSVYRAVIMSSMGFKDANQQAPLYFKPTQEMLAEFSYLGAEKAFEIVITNPNDIADMCEPLTAYLNEQSTYAPVFEGGNDELRNMAVKRVHELYGEELPVPVQERLDFELHSIIDNGYATLYLMAQRLVFKSMSDGYLVGSRGSVGSSFVAFLAGITEINPLTAHYLCPNPECKLCEFDDTGYSCGADMPNRDCPNCHTPMKKMGFDIPFQTFLGFKGDKTPDIDLNFSGEYHAVAHEYTRTMFGADHAYRAGVINTLQDKTAMGYARKYCEQYDMDLTQAELTALTMGCVGVKQTTGQHPGGMVIIPEEYEAEDFLPLQYPANKKEGNNLITHFDFHAMHDKLVKLDILGHVDPTALRMLRDLTGLNPQDIPLDDPPTRQLFYTNEPLNIDLSEINCDVGTLGIPEYGTNFVRGILCETRPHTIEELVRIAGLSHGTNVWSGNAQVLIKDGKATLSNVIGTRDDIMRYLISVGCEPLMAFKTMESVRKGKGLTDEMEACLKTLPLPNWYIDSCKKIKYMFPRAHAAAYLTMAFRVAYYKMHYPAEYYAVFFTTRAPEFDINICGGDADTVLRTIRRATREIKMQQKKTGRGGNNNIDDDDLTGDETVDKMIKLLPILEIAYEMNLRGIHFINIDINKSDATKFLVVSPAEILPPFSSIGGMGATQAMQIVDARKKRDGRPFTSVEDFRDCTKTGRTLLLRLDDLGCFEGMAESDQMTLF